MSVLTYRNLKPVSKQFSAEIDDLRPNPWNSNHVGPDNETKLRASIRQFGLFKPIVVRELFDADTNTHYEILGGEHRWDAAREEGLTEIPVFNVGVIDDDIAKRITLADNARYGQDDTIELAKLLEDIGDVEGLQAVLPYTESDLNSIFSSVDIALDELDLPESYTEDAKDQAPEAKPEKVAKTHTIMRFKVAIADAEKVAELIAKTQKRQGLTAADELTNAGDALIHLLFNAAAE
ncbi:ParB-like nuclease domain-containing protein [Bradyrhizobium sp. 179]|nr:ParB/RepB/Spo0J family partition protein [Bradyrhizobium sp. 179]MCK1543402.1 ParB-like nuclease domain-containing protein [Bradyrhizobium sp. 179]